jgi:hypothetical protein
MKENINTVLNLIFTLDYEIHGNGDGSPYDLIVEPTYRLMTLLEKYGAKLTIHADVAEILCFKKYYEETGEDKFFYKEIEKQLQEAIRRGHDVQLHIHSSYFNATYNGKSWEQFWPEYNMAALDFQRIDEIISTSKQFLENILKPISADYSCYAFRAANWSMMPTENIYKALIKNGLHVDTSVYKGGRQQGNVDYDYTDAFSHLYAYKADASNINLQDVNGQLTEYPIYTEMRHFWSFITPIRLFRMVRAKFHKHKSAHRVATLSPSTNNSSNKLSWRSFFVKSPWKLDFNQASGLQLINALKRIKKQTKDKKTSIDVVLIGHSKTFVPYNEKSLDKFLYWTSKQTNISFSHFKKL